MEETSVLEELWKIKDEIAAQYSSFEEYFKDMLRYQAETHPEFAKYASEQTPAHV